MEYYRRMNLAHAAHFSPTQSRRLAAIANPIFKLQVTPELIPAKSNPQLR
jgi:hypothetical protein